MSFVFNSGCILEHIDYHFTEFNIYFQAEWEHQLKLELVDFIFLVCFVYLQYDYQKNIFNQCDPLKKIFSEDFDFCCWLEAYLGIQDSVGRYQCVGLKRANDIIGTTTEELVLKAKQGSMTSWWCFQNVLICLMYM